MQGPGESIYLPHGLAHTVLNLRDNVAVTENFLFVDALPELMSKVALDEISMFRPGWDEPAIKKLYYGLVSAKVSESHFRDVAKLTGFLQDRAAMRSMYDQAVKRLNERPQFCAEAEHARKEKYKAIFGEVPEAAPEGRSLARCAALDTGEGPGVDCASREANS